MVGGIVMATVPPVHSWLAGDEMNAMRMNEIKDQIDFLRNPPMVHVARLNTAQTLTNTWNFISFDTVVNSYDPYTMWDSGNPDQLTCTIAGWYWVQGQFAISSTATDERLILGVYKNGKNSGTDVEMRSDVQNAPAHGSNTWSKEFHVYLDEGDWIHLGVHIETDASRTTTLGGVSDCCRMRMRWVSK